MSIALKERLEFAVRAARASSSLTLEYFGRHDRHDATVKADGSPVTAADRACEQDLRTRIIERFPDDAILGEEFDARRGTTGHQWVIDPIDGTISFVRGVPLYGTMLACMKDDRPQLGVIVMPALDETVYAADGLGCWHAARSDEPTRCRIAPVERLSEAIVCTTSMSYFTTPARRSLYEQLDRASQHTRGWSDCYAWVLLATGRVDAVIEPVLHLWDYAAAIPLVREAGGSWSDFRGQESLKSGEIIAGNPPLVREIRELIDRTGAVEARP